MARDARDVCAALELASEAMAQNADDLELVLRGHTRNAQHAEHLKAMVKGFRSAARYAQMLRAHLGRQVAAVSLSPAAGGR